MKIPRGSYGDESLAPAWIAVSDGKGGAAKPLIRCQCGRLAGIGLHHVHADGRVTASFYHPVKGWEGDNAAGCGFHEMLELDGYDGPDFPPVPKKA